MRVILKKDVENLGSKGDIVDVAPGFGRNYLIPKKLALEVTSSNMKMIEIERQALKKRLEKERQSFEGLTQKLNQVVLSFERKAGEKDMIFGSVSSSDIKDALQELGFEIDKKKILLEEPLKRLGNYSVPIKIFQEDRAEVKVEVIKPEEDKGEEKRIEGAPAEKMEEVVAEKEGLEEEKKEKGEAPGEKKEKKEEIEDDSLKPGIEVEEKKEKEALDKEKEEGVGPSDESKQAETEAEREAQNDRMGKEDTERSKK
jgi:large subunit ribosomal protein L9